MLNSWPLPPPPRRFLLQVIGVVSQLWSQSHVVSPVSWPPFTFRRRLTWLQQLRCPIRECCLCSSSLIFNFFKHGHSERASSMPEYPGRCSTTTPLHQSSESSLVDWPALKSEGECVKSSAKHLPRPKHQLWSDRMCLSLFCFSLQVTTVSPNDKQEASESLIQARVTGVNGREGARPNINDSCSYYSPRNLRQA